MKSRILVFITCLGFYAESAYASGGPPAPFYEMPSYIDWEYKAPDSSEISYGQKTKFNLLLGQYENAAQSQATANDADARAASKKQEPENFSLYLKGAEKFNAQAYEDALKIFTELENLHVSIKDKLRTLFGNKNHSWVKEASTYMIARCQLIIAQKNWDGYSEPLKVVDQILLRQADASYQRYLKEYPNGLYANSARNIRRKIFYLSKNRQELNQELRRIILEKFPVSLNSTPHTINTDIITEFENYFNGEIDIAHDSPMLVAYAWLGDQKPKVQEIKMLEAREKDFKAYPGLFRYVYALGLYRLEQYKELLEKTPEDVLTKNVLSLSTQILRSRAFAQLQKSDEALAALKEMHAVSPEDSVELEIAYLKLNSGDGLWLYTNQSPLKTEKNLRSFAQFGLRDDELEKGLGMKEITGDKRKFLIDELARRYVLTKQFKKLTVLLAKEIGTGIFDPLKPLSKKLAENINNAQALADIGEFLYQHYITPSATYGGYESNRWSANALTDLLKHCKPCQKFKDRTQNYVPPIQYFRSAAEIIQRSGVKSQAEAKALHYIVKCGRQGGEFEERCTWHTTGDKTAGDYSRAAFMRLHKTYKESPWKLKTPYYY